MRLWLIEHKRGGRLYGEFGNDSANMIDDPVGFLFLLIFFQGKVDGSRLIRPLIFQQGAHWSSIVWDKSTKESNHVFSSILIGV